MEKQKFSDAGIWVERGNKLLCDFRTNLGPKRESLRIEARYQRNIQNQAEIVDCSARRTMGSDKILQRNAVKVKGCGWKCYVLWIRLLVAHEGINFLSKSSCEPNSTNYSLERKQAKQSLDTCDKSP
eukprot:5546225-Amphidinium_carterae.1